MTDTDAVREQLARWREDVETAKEMSLEGSSANGRLLTALPLLLDALEVMYAALEWYANLGGMVAVDCGYEPTFSRAEATLAAIAATLEGARDE